MKDANSKAGNNCEIYQRFIEDRYSRNDVTYIIKHHPDSDADKSLKNICKDYWYRHFDNQAESESESDFEYMLDKIHHRINLEDNKPLGIQPGNSSRKIIEITLAVYYRIAAIIVFGLILAGVYNYIKNEAFLPENKIAYSEVVAPMGSRIKIDLPDGSTAWLNNGTVLKYPQKYGKKSRELFISGEAYFNVKKEKHRPFILKTSNVDIHVLGTSFNVMAYEDDRDIEVTLETGKLDLYSSSTDKSHEKIASLKPGEHIVIDKDLGEISRQSGNTDVYTAWKEGIMIFRDDPMDIIVTKLERWYNVDIELADKELTNHIFTATFTDETLSQALHLLSIAVPIKYDMAPRVKQSDGGYSKRKVILHLKD
jgi:transmembrane sensor